MKNMIACHAANLRSGTEVWKPKTLITGLYLLYWNGYGSWVDVALGCRTPS